MKKSRFLDLPDEMREALKRLAGPYPLIALLNHYKGVAIVSEAFLQSFDLQTATLRTHPHQAVCLALENQTRVQSRTLSLAVQARVAAVEVATGLTQLTEFKPAAYVTERRLSVRPELARSIEIELSAQNWTSHARLETISLASVEVYLPASEIYFEPEIVFREGADLQARFRLPGADQSIGLTGSVLRGAPQGDDYALSIKLATDGLAQKMIQDHILQRRAVVAQELQVLYEQMAHASRHNNQM